jgi:hypothetical protein
VNFDFVEILLLAIGSDGAGCEKRSAQDYAAHRVTHGRFPGGAAVGLKQICPSAPQEQ